MYRLQLALLLPEPASRARDAQKAAQYVFPLCRYRKDARDREIVRSRDLELPLTLAMVVSATWICCPRGLSFLTDHDGFVF